MIEQLLDLGVPRKELLEVEVDGKAAVLRLEEFKAMHTWDVTDVKSMRGWVKALEQHGVYFSTPLDLDYMMLRRFPDAYEAAADDGEGPNIPEDSTLYQQVARKVVRSVLKEGSTRAETYTEDEVKAFFWYRYLFLGRGKPSTHILALSRMSDGDLRDKAPPVLVRLIKAIGTTLAKGEAEETDDD